jgi:hypothetical protein
MPRRHPHTFRRPKSANDALADFERVLYEPENAPIDQAPPNERPSIDYRPILAVIAIVIFSLALISFIFTLRAHRKAWPDERRPCRTGREDRSLVDGRLGIKNITAITALSTLMAVFCAMFYVRPYRSQCAPAITACTLLNPCLDLLSCSPEHAKEGREWRAYVG